jgi:hypothetical protein
MLSCSGGGGDPPRSLGAPSALGQGSRIRDVINPALETKALAGTAVNVTGASVVYVDTFDEVGDGSSRGAIYVEDLDVGSRVDAGRGFSGVSLFSPTFIPSDLKVTPGDVLDLNGLYTEALSRGAAKFKNGPLVQLERPVANFRFEAAPIPATVIDVNDLLTYETGRKWMGMLVTVRDVSFEGDPVANKGRLTNVVVGATDNRDSPVVSNELMRLTADDLAKGKRFKSITGVCTYFFNLKIAPRSAADFVLAE